jgi:hypothetical protein
MTTDEELDQLREEKSALRAQVAMLSERISTLEAQLAKESHNSHLPPIAFIGSPRVCASTAASTLEDRSVIPETP